MPLISIPTNPTIGGTSREIKTLLEVEDPITVPCDSSPISELPKQVDYYVNALKRKVCDENGEFRFSLNLFNNFLDNFNTYRYNRSITFERNKTNENELHNANQKIRELEQTISNLKNENKSKSSDKFEKLTKSYANARTRLSRKNTKLRQVTESVEKLEEKMESVEFKKEVALSLVRDNLYVRHGKRNHSTDSIF